MTAQLTVFGPWSKPDFADPTAAAARKVVAVVTLDGDRIESITGDVNAAREVVEVLRRDPFR